jgi:hypothetical protein
VLKSLFDITIKDVILLDATQKADSLKKYRFIPLWFCKKELEELTKKVFDLIGGQSTDDLQREFDKLLAYRRIKLLEALYKAVDIEVNLKSRINAWKIILDRDFKDSEQLEKVLIEVKKHTEIDIKTPENLKEFEDYIQHKIDKFQEMFPDIEKPEVNLMKVIYSVFNFLSEPYAENMRLITFVELKELAEERIRHSRNGIESGNSAD